MTVGGGESPSEAGATLWSNMVSEQHATQNERLQLPANSHASTMMVAAWLTRRHLCCPPKRCCTLVRKHLVQSHMAMRPSPKPDGYHTEDQESSISGKWVFRVLV